MADIFTIICIDKPIRKLFNAFSNKLFDTDIKKVQWNDTKLGLPLEIDYFDKDWRDWLKWY